jgi:hypothetical protein
MSQNRSAGFVDEFRSDFDQGDTPAGDNVKGLKRYYGKYRGVVVTALDPEQRGRLFVRVTDINGPNITNWAVPCLPWGGLSMGSHVVPPTETNVWVEFEQGDPHFPIWVGCFWGTAIETPTIAKLSVPSAPIFALETMLKHAFVITDTPLLPYLPSGGILIGNPASCIAIDMTGVRLFGLTVQFNGDPAGLAPMAAALLVTK